MNALRKIDFFTICIYNIIVHIILHMFSFENLLMTYICVATFLFSVAMILRMCKYLSSAYRNVAYYCSEVKHTMRLFKRTARTVRSFCNSTEDHVMFLRDHMENHMNNTKQTHVLDTMDRILKLVKALITEEEYNKCVMIYMNMFKSAFMPKFTSDFKSDRTPFGSTYKREETMPSASKNAEETMPPKSNTEKTMPCASKTEETINYIIIDESEKELSNEIADKDAHSDRELSTSSTDEIYKSDKEKHHDQSAKSKKQKKQKSSKRSNI